ncbi:hypothetical protein OG21DRAFT_1527223 [Imleria badia]|nr:hypothetical protein OG21DRAFT_1527223 [Imleria badia]
MRSCPHQPFLLLLLHLLLLLLHQHDNENYHELIIAERGLLMLRSGANNMTRKAGLVTFPIFTIFVRALPAPPVSPVITFGIAVGLCECRMQRVQVTQQVYFSCLLVPPTLQ